MHVVAGADAGQQRDLLAAKSRGATPIAATEVDVFRLDPFASRPRELRGLVGTSRGRASQR